MDERLHAPQNVFPVPLTWCFRKKYIFPGFPARIKKKHFYQLSQLFQSFCKSKALNTLLNKIKHLENALLSFAIKY